MNLDRDYFLKFWLNGAIFLVLLMIFVGGLTRLTESGLSITEWQIISGILPPFSESGWQELFIKYQTIPEFSVDNPDMTLDGFKQIFWLEYIHRLLGRAVGLFIIIPAFFFLRFIDKQHRFILFSLLFLLPMQGVMGWLMVKSGLSIRTDVSHFRLALHFSLALIIFLFLIEFKLRLQKGELVKFKFNIWSLIFALIFVQIVFGAFVAGLRAGYIYNSYPLMGNSYIPSDLMHFDSLFTNVIYHPTMIQFLHRNIGLLIFAVVVLTFIFKFREAQKQKQLVYLQWLVIIVFIQFFLGVATLLSNVNMAVALLHQLVAAILLGASYISLRKLEI